MISRSHGAAPFILFEVLELPWLVLQLYVKDNPDSHLARLLARSLCAHVITEEPARDELRFWVTSATMHRGVSQSVHRLEFINQIDPLAYPPMWVELARQGRRIGVFGASFSHPWKDAALPQTAFYVPDKFAPDDWATPVRAIAYHRMLRFLSRLTDQGHGKSHARLHGSLAIFHFLLSRIIRLRFGAVRFLTRGWNLHIFRLPRASVSARLAFYEFITLHKLRKPDFSLFATGALATALHKGISPYLQASARDKSRRPTPMAFALDELNAEVGMLLEVADRTNATLVVASGYGQEQSGDDGAIEDDQSFWLLLHPDMLIKWMGLQTSARAVPSMLPCTTLWFDSGENQSLAVQQLNQLRNQDDGTPLFHLEEGERCISLKATPNAHSLRSGHVQYRFGDGQGHDLPMDGLGLVERRRKALAGDHAPGGVLIVHRHDYAGETWVADVDVAAIAPTLMLAMGAKPSAAMNPPAQELLQKMLGG
jgi:hypothetical protein